MAPGIQDVASLAQSEIDFLTEQMDCWHLGAHEILENSADGNCQYMAISQALFGDEVRWKEVKDHALDTVGKDPLLKYKVHVFLIL